MGDNQLNKWAVEWYPKCGYLSDTKHWDGTPDGLQGGDDAPGADTLALVDVGKGMFTYIPNGRKVVSTRGLGAWGAGIGESEAWVNRDIVGHYVLVRVYGDIDAKLPDAHVIDVDGKRIYIGDALPPLIMETDFPTDEQIEDELFTEVNPTRGWMFACVSGYDSYSGLHSLVFRNKGVYYPGYEVELNKCVFQEWVRPAMRRLNAKRAVKVDTVTMEEEDEVGEKMWMDIQDTDAAVTNKKVVKTPVVVAENVVLNMPPFISATSGWNSSVKKMDWAANITDCSVKYDDVGEAVEKPLISWEEEALMWKDAWDEGGR